jgi:hypothetical protein
VFERLMGENRYAVTPELPAALGVEIAGYGRGRGAGVDGLAVGSERGQQRRREGADRQPGVRSELKRAALLQSLKTDARCRALLTRMGPSR